MVFGIFDPVKELVRTVRSSKTAAEERSALAKECAKVRCSLHNESSRKKNILKLLFIHLWGYPTNFGQIECIKLLASNKFSHKRIGYLALNLLLTEDNELLMLATNSIKMDLNSTNPYASELALKALANIGTVEMYRELQYEIDQLLKSNIPNVKKKAAICAARMLRKVGQMNMTPSAADLDLASTYVQYIPGLLGDYNHGVIMSGLNMMSVFIEHFPQCCDYGLFFTVLLKTIKMVISENSTGRSGGLFSDTKEYEFDGINDPFLQVRLLELIRLVYSKTKDERMGIELYDLVSGIIESTVSTTMSGSTILYECARTIYHNLNDEKFNKLGLDVVNKFINSNNNNIKYVALGILNNLVDVQMECGDRKWVIIIQSFNQRDISIRRRALDVSLKMVNKNTLKPLMQHLFNLLIVDNELKREAVSKIARALNIHSDEFKYKLESLVKIFTIAGNHVPDDILNNFIALISAAPREVQIEVTLNLFVSIKNNLGQGALVKAALWCIGEYGDYLLDVELPKAPRVGRTDEDEKLEVKTDGLLLDLSSEPMVSDIDTTEFLIANGSKKLEDEFNLLSFLPNAADEKKNTSASREYSVNSFSPLTNEPVAQEGGLVRSADSPSSLVLDLVELVAKRVLSNMQENITNGEYLLTCVAKLVQRMPMEGPRLKKVIKRFKRHPDAELQQRACELDILVDVEPRIINKILDKVPQVDSKVIASTKPRQPDINDLFDTTELVKTVADFKGSLLDISPVKKSPTELIDFFIDDPNEANDTKDTNEKADDFEQFNPF